MNTKITIVSLALSLILSSCNMNSSGNSKDIVKDNFEFAAEQLSFAFDEIEVAKQNDNRDAEVKEKNPKFSPRTINKKGELELVVARDWTSGFFPGTLWYMYEYTKDPKWEQAARKFTAPIEPQQFTTSTHDLGFILNNSFGNGLRLTGDKTYEPILIQAANSLISRYKPDAKVIRSWDHNRDKWQCPVIIDNMMNLELLFWASKVTGDEKYYDIAVNHANTTIDNHFRSDYGTYHVIDYDTITGEVLNKHTHQGFANESTWSRGEAWAIYGYTMCYRETGDIKYLEQANHVADFIFNNPNLPEDLVPYWDFDAPEIPNEPRDVSAATVTASALYELSLYSKERSKQYKQWADTILDNVTANYRATLNSDRGFLLLHSTGSKPANSEVDVPLSYADYYFLEALIRKDKVDNNIPFH